MRVPAARGSTPPRQRSQGLQGSARIHAGHRGVSAEDESQANGTSMESSLMEPAGAMEGVTDGEYSEHLDATSSAGGSARPLQKQNQGAPAYMRLYREKDDRRRRLEDAKLRRMEEEEEDIRASAQRALGRSPSQGALAGSPLADGSMHGHVGAHPQHSYRQRTATSPPKSRPSSANNHAGSQKPRRVAGPAGVPGALPRRQHSETSIITTVSPSAAMPPTGPARHLATLASTSMVDVHGLDASSAASENGGSMHGLHRVPSDSVLGGDDETFTGASSQGGPQHFNASSDEEVHSLRQMVQSQQQRIECLEGLHQQALRQLRRAREELSVAQQQRFREADKVLGMEQLVSEMQAAMFAAPEMYARWGDWLDRSRSILQAE